MEKKIFAIKMSKKDKRGKKNFANPPTISILTAKSK